jgi:two-component system nitrate/nitrite response regulator NarL
MHIRSLIGCDDAIAGQSLRSGLEQDVGGGKIAAEWVCLDELVQRAAAARPDVLLVELEADEQQRWKIFDRLRQISPSSRILTLCCLCTQKMLIDAIAHGVSGCLLKTNDSALVAKAIRTVHAGETWYGRTALLLALQSQVCVAPAPVLAVEDEHKLTPREDEILHLIGSGLSNKEIARRLDISDKTVKTHLHRVYVKLNRSGRYKAFLSQPDARPAAA